MNCQSAKMADKTRGRRGLSIKDILLRLHLLPGQNNGNLSYEEHPDGSNMSDGGWDATSDSESGEGSDCLLTASTCMYVDYSYAQNNLNKI